MTWTLDLIGTFELAAPDGVRVDLTSPRLQMLVAVLALEDGRPVDRPRLWTLLWEDRAEAQARNSLRQAFTTLRKVCTGPYPFPFRIDARAAATIPEVLRVDVPALLKAKPGTDPCELPRFGELLAGLHVPGADAQAWLGLERQRWHAAYARSAIDAIEASERRGDAAAAVRQAEALIEADPLNEAAYRAAMRGLLALGDRVEALRRFQTCCDLLRSELGIGPAAETLVLHRELSSAITATPDPAQPIPPAAIPRTAKPSIVVLPFSSHGDTGATPDYFADSLTESLTDDLSRFHDLHVVASRSANAYRDDHRDVGDICRDLGVRYALSGSVRREAARLRVQARLIDGADGHLVWTERYDRGDADLPDVRDELSEVIVATLATTYGGRLRKASRRNAGSAPAPGSEAYDCFVRGIDQVDQWTAEAVGPGLALLERAVELDPGFAKAHAKLSFCYIIEAHEGWTTDFEAGLARGFRKARDAIEADKGEPWGHWALSYCHLFAGQHELCQEAIGRALRLNPNDADILADLGLYQSFAGRPEAGLETLLRAMRLNPHYPDWYALQLLQVQFDARHYADAIRTHARLRSASPLADLYLAASLAASGDGTAATKAMQKVTAETPDVVARIRSDPRRSPYRRAEDLAHFLDSLDLADR